MFLFHEQHSFQEKKFILYLCRMSRDLYPRVEISQTTDQIDNELNESRFMLSDLIIMLERRSVERHYENAMKGMCEGTLLGLTIMTVAGLATAFLLTLLVCVDSHTWIYLSQKYVEFLLIDCQRFQ